MAHAKSLRVIGQSLETARVQAFELETDGPNYVLRSDSLTAASEWILRHALRPNDFSKQSARQPIVSRSVRFALADISRLDDQAQKQRRVNSSPHNKQTYQRLSQLLRAMGDQLDRTEVNSFHISWTSNSASVDFQSMDGESNSRIFTVEKLEQLGSHSRFRQSSGTRLDTNLPGSLKQPDLNRSSRSKS
jgi:hypothetical protein